VQSYSRNRVVYIFKQVFKL